MAIRGDSVQAGAICAEILSGDYSAESVCVEYRQVSMKPWQMNNNLCFFFFSMPQLQLKSSDFVSSLLLLFPLAAVNFDELVN